MEIQNGKVTHVRCQRISDGVHRDLAVAIAEDDGFLAYNNWRRADPEYDEYIKCNKGKKLTISAQVIKKPTVNSETITELSDTVVLTEKAVEQPEVKTDEPKKRQREQKTANV